VTSRPLSRLRSLLPPRSGEGTDSGGQPRESPYYGWVLMVVLGITTIVSYGTTQYLFGVLIVPLDATFGWGRASISGAYALGLIVAGLLGVPIGSLVDRWGARLLMSSGSALAALALFGLARVNTLGQFYLLWSGGLGLAMALTLYPVAFMISRGTDAVLAATLSGMLGLASLPGRYVFNVLSSRISAQKLLALSVVAQAAGIAVVVLASSLGWLILYVLIYGCAYGAFSPLRASVMADHFGRRAYGAITAVQGIPVAVCAGLGPLAAGWLYDGLHHYEVAFWMCACAFLLAASGIALAPRPKAQQSCSTHARAVTDEDIVESRG
jgi:MFS family permease